MATCFSVHLEDTSCGGGDCVNAGVFDPADFHAEVLCLNDDHDTFRIDSLNEGVCNLSCQTLLQLRTAAIAFHQTSQFGQPYDSAISGLIGNMSHAHDRQQVVLTVAPHFDVAHYDGFIRTFV